jgi:transcription-repair coupling factor (superfamily II helicase)
MMFYLTSATMEQVQALVSEYKGRVTVNGSDKPYIAVKLAAGDKPMEVMESVVNIMHNAIQS